MRAKNRALVIGISDYPPPITHLPGVAADVREISALLGSSDSEFDRDNMTVLTDKDATRENVLRALREVLGEATGGTVFLYLAGHGDLDGDEYFFIPFDANYDNPAGTAVQLTELKALFDASRCDQVMAWLDFCHSGGILSRGHPSATGQAAADAIERTLRVVQGSGKVIMTACTADQKAYEDAGHGRFTRFLIQGLKGAATNSAGEVTASSLHDYVDREMGSGRQRPMFFGKMTGRIVLMRRRGLSGKQEIVDVAAGDASSLVVNTSGSWVLLNGRFYESESVRYNADRTITVKINSKDSESDAAIRWLTPKSTGQPSTVAFAHRNDGCLVMVKSVEADSRGEDNIWTLGLRPVEISIGIMSEIGYGGQQPLSADDIAKLRASRILLNTPPDIRSPKEASEPVVRDSMVELLVRGINVPIQAKFCPLRTLYPALKEDPKLFLQLARLTAIFALKTSCAIEHVTKLSLGPVNRETVHVEFQGVRQKVYSNVEPTVIELTGECALT